MAMAGKRKFGSWMGKATNNRLGRRPGYSRNLRGLGGHKKEMQLLDQGDDLVCACVGDLATGRFDDSPPNLQRLLVKCLRGLTALMESERHRFSLLSIG